MVEQDRDMEIIALLSNVQDGYTYINCNNDVVDHECEKTGEKAQIELIELEYFKDGQYMEDKANYCEHCNQVFVYRP